MFKSLLAETEAKLLEDKAIVSYLDWKDVPDFSQDLEVETPVAVASVRKAVLAAIN
ncbi:hypothetical protein [Streptococcus saliviloxodontae]|uniref:NAD(P)H-dependent FMN reductase n=1 Tax=Streptococcus saliviloxodontae TaxID=1349416 RepID=A0ABS2PNK4_9STRE|nr:NAD(P)H-dependent FMN reductase [Streptococcus saliviloxodontae]